ncbi:MAG: hypothetical protein EKK64_03250 [Neisseriaceae bacterium]|nr:MAG: hypothetical protein EKK64_03250 [Neisseriaceae bacterium]
MRSFKNFRGIVENENIPAQVDNQKEQEIVAKINAIVDSWTQELISLLLKSSSGSGSGAKRGLWDRFKGTVSNLWHGRDGESNPYKWVNKFGDNLGQRESFSLEQYKNLKETCDILEHQINEDVENLRIFQLIKSAAAKLKQDLHTALVSKPEISNSGNATIAPVAADSRPKNPSPVAAEPLKQTVAGSKSSPESEIEPEIYQRHKHLPPESNLAQATTQPAKEAPEEKVPEKKEEPSQVSSQQQKVDFYTNPPTSGLAWENLNASHIEKWNKYGGGTGNNIGGDCFKFTKGTPITKLPYILRIGDPRIEIIRSQKLDGPMSFNQRFLDKEELAANRKLASTPDFNPEKHCTKKNAAIWNSLIRNKRIEGEENFGPPIKDEQDLRNRVEIIKQNMAKEPRDSAATQPFNPPDSIEPTTPTIAPSLTATKEDRKKNKEEATKVAPSTETLTPKRGRGRPKKKVEVPSWLKDSQEEPKDMEEPHVPHISPIPDEKSGTGTGKEEPEKDIETARQEAEEALKGGSPKVFKKYFTKVEEAETVKDLEKLKSAILHMKKLENDDSEGDLEELPEWTLKDTKELFRRKYLK